MSRGQFNFQGGSQSDSLARGNSSFGLFKAGIDVMWPSTRKPNRRQRILPARDANLLPNDSAFLDSVVPYRLRGSTFLDEDTKTEPFSGWYQTLLAHKSAGRSQEDFISPNMLAGLPGIVAADCADPLVDCHNVARDSGIAMYVALTERSKVGEREQGAVLPYAPRGLVAYNVIYSDSPSNMMSWKNAIAVATPTAHKALKDSLARRTPAGFPPLDPDWPMYLLGDITSLAYGLLGWMQKQAVGTVDAWLTKFSAGDYEAHDAVKFPIPAGHACLTKRYNLNSSDTLNIPTYQEIVDWMVVDGAFPRELIARACGHMANVPAGGPQNQTAFNGAAHAGAGFGGGAPAGGFGAPALGYGGGAPAGGFGGAPSGGFGGPPAGFSGAPMNGFMPHSEQIAPDDHDDTPEPAPVRERIFYASHPSLGQAPVECTTSQIMTLSDEVLKELQVVPKDLPNGTAWALGVVYGLVRNQPVQAPPAPPAPSFAPQAPAQPAAAPQAFGAAPQTMGFAQSAAAPQQPAFGAAPQAFGAAPQAPAFGAAPQAMGFTQPPQAQPEAAPQAFGAVPQASAFGAPAQQPAFGAVPQAPAFGAAPQQQPAFGAAPQAPAQQAFDSMPTAPAAFAAPQAPQQPAFAAPQAPAAPAAIAPSMGAQPGAPTGTPLTQEENNKLEELRRIAATNPQALKADDFMTIASLTARSQGGA